MLNDFDFTPLVITSLSHLVDYLQNILNFCRETLYSIIKAGIISHAVFRVV